MHKFIKSPDDVLAVTYSGSITGNDLDAAGHRVRFDGVLLELTRYECGLLETLLARPEAVFERAALMDRVWSDALETGERTVDTHVSRLRKKLELGGEHGWRLAAIYQHGYRLEQA